MRARSGAARQSHLDWPGDMGRMFIAGTIALVGGIVSMSTGHGIWDGLGIIAIGIGSLGLWGVWLRRRGLDDIRDKVGRPAGRHWRKPHP
jgi:hypothetical protein